MTKAHRLSSEPVDDIFTLLEMYQATNIVVSKADFPEIISLETVIIPRCKAWSLMFVFTIMKQISNTPAQSECRIATGGIDANDVESLGTNSKIAI